MISLSGISKSFTQKSTQRTNDYLLSRLFNRITPGKRVKEKICVLENIDLEISAGSTTAIIGRNRSGKTTLMQLIAGILSPTSGKMSIVGKVVPIFGLGVGFSTILTGRENLTLNATSLGATMEWVHQNIDAIQRFAEIEDLDIPLKFFSNGSKTRLALAIAVFMPADVLLLDEVFDGVDVFFREKALCQILQNVQTNKTTLLVVSHDEEILKRLCSSAVFLKNGKVAAQGDINLLARYKKEL
jgi:ABC-type polysaccharide/polyol phosphate transport system ATPase subunit